MRSQNSPRRRPFSRPCVEQLEHRWTPSVSAAGNAVTIRGTSGSDQIVVYDNGTNGPGALLVYENGTRTFTSSGPVGGVHISTLGGADTVVYRQVSPLLLPGASRERDIDIDLGDGNDLASLNFFSIINSIYDVVVQGGRGNDQIQASAGGKIVGQPLRGGRLVISMFGGEGDDFLDVRAFNDVGQDGIMTVQQTGGAGSDLIIHQYEGKLNGTYFLSQVSDRDRNDAAFNFVSYEPGSTRVLSYF
jgi:hypothetical protein